MLKPVLLPALLALSSHIWLSAQSGGKAGDPVVRAGEVATLKARLQAVVDRLHEQGSFPGINAAVVGADGRLVAVSAGVTDRARKRPLRPEDRMLAGSVGKTYVAAIAMQLVKEGKLDLEATVERYLGRESWFSRLPNAQDMTVRMVMNHTSGLERHEFKPELHKELGRRPDKAWKPEELLSYLFDDKPLFAAGQGWGYSDSNYIVLGMILEHLTGKPYFELLRSRILAPLGLKDTIPSESRRMPGLIQGYAGEDNPFGGTDAMLKDGLLPFNPQSEWTGGGVASTASDLARWAKLLYEGKAFDPSLLPLMLKGVATDGGPDEQYGLGVILRKSRLGLTYGHSGFFPGYRTQMLYFPEHKLAVAIQMNTSVPGALPKPHFEMALDVAQAAVLK